MYIDSQSNSLCLWCHSAKNRKKLGIFLLCQIQVCRAGDQRVKFLDTPFKSNEWWNPCKWTYLLSQVLTELLGASSLGMCWAWFSHTTWEGCGALYYIIHRIRPEFPLVIYSGLINNFCIFALFLLKMQMHCRNFWKLYCQKHREKRERSKPKALISFFFYGSWSEFMSQRKWCHIWC